MDTTDQPEKAPSTAETSELGTCVQWAQRRRVEKPALERRCLEKCTVVGDSVVTDMLSLGKAEEPSAWSRGMPRWIRLETLEKI